MSRRPTRWEQKVQSDPQHSHWFVERFRRMAAEGKDLHGEARLADVLAPRGARVLDAGCGGGRVGGELARRGHTVVGVDVDPVLVDAARQDHPAGRWLVGDLAELDLGTVDPAGPLDPFDVVVCAGNVMPFLAEGTEVEVLRRLGAAVRPAGRIAIGFGTGRGYPADRFHDDVGAAGLRVELTLATWDLRPFQPDGDFLVAVLSTAPGLAAGDVP